MSSINSHSFCSVNYAMITSQKNEGSNLKEEVPPIANDLSSTSQPNQQNPFGLSRIQQLKEEYKALKTLDSTQTEFPITVPERRSCGVGGMESEPLVEAAKNAVFIADKEIIKIHPLKFLPKSPFITSDNEFWAFYEQITEEPKWKNMVDSAKKQAQAIAITNEGKHVILQQAITSSVPTCMAMLILDQGKQPNYKAIRFTVSANTEQAIKWAETAGLKCQVNKISKENPIKQLSEYLSARGPGMLAISQPTPVVNLDEIAKNPLRLLSTSQSWHPPVVILDEISVEKNEAVIRDSFHGWMITIQLNTLKALIRPNGDFVQLI